MVKALVLVALLALTVGGPGLCLVATGVLATRVVRLVRLRIEDSRAGDRRTGERLAGESLAGERLAGDRLEGRPGLATVSSLRWLAALVPVGTIEAYAYGALKYSPGLFPDKTCYFSMGARAFPDSSGLLPLSTVCRGQEIVPVWFNPLMAVLAVASVALLATVVFAYARPGSPEEVVSPASERAE